MCIMFLDALLYGSDVVTMPGKVFDKMYDHVLTEKGLDLFQQDWNSINSLNNGTIKPNYGLLEGSKKAAKETP